MSATPRDHRPGERREGDAAAHHPDRAAAAAAASAGIVPSRDFYQEYHGHRVEHLRTVLSHLRSAPSTSTSRASAGTRGVIWTAGDSSLDNKYWLADRVVVPAVSPYRDVLDPPLMKPDVTYWLNRLLSEEENGEQHTAASSSFHDGGAAGMLSARTRPTAPASAINAAVEATTINERTFCLRPQDIFLRDHLQPNDVLIVSLGGNDVALGPLPCTIVSVGCLALCLPDCLIEKSCTACALPLDDACCGFGTSLLSCLGSCPPCVGYVRHLLGVRVQSYIQRLTSKTQPRLVLVCTIYYPDENRASPSWANGTLAGLGYNSNPRKLQALIRLVHERATSQIRIVDPNGNNVPVVPVPLYVVLDGRTTEDYVARVEPSASGGQKVAEFLLRRMRQHDRDAPAPYVPPPSHPPTPTAMQDRG